MNPRHADIVATLQHCLKHIRNTSKILIRMTQAQASVADWQSLYKTVYNATYVGDICRSQAAKVPIFHQIGSMFTEDLQKITNLIGKIVDFDESAVQNRFVVKPNVDPKLDEKKRTYNGLPDFMTKIARDELEKLNDDIQECSVIYLPQLGYMLAIPLNPRLRQKENYTMDALEFVFLSNETLYYKSARTRALDEMLGDTQCDVNDHEVRIMHRLQDTILQHCQCLVDISQYMAQLDCLIALAVCAREGNYCRPQLTNDSVINIKAGRHPLQELCCSPFVPNDTSSGGDNASRMKILTGPNTSGKSIYLKQVAIIVFMAHIGSYVPAESAVIGATDRIFTRIRTLESVSVGLSTFMIDLNQVCAAVQNATANSLVILDEFGKGTIPADGEALLCACLRLWLKTRGRACPHTFVSTHFHGALSHLPKSPLLSGQTMEVMHDGSELIFLYQLIDGSTNYSYACQIADNEGLPTKIVKRGTQVSKLLVANQNVGKIDTANTIKQHEKSEKIVDLFMNLEMDKDDLQAFLKGVIAINQTTNK